MLKFGRQPVSPWKRDPFMGSIVTKEVGELNDHLGQSDRSESRTTKTARLQLKCK